MDTVCWVGPAPTSSSNDCCVVPFEMFSLGTEHHPSSSPPSSFYGYHLLDGAHAPASSGDGGVISMDGSPSGTDYDLFFSSHAFLLSTRWCPCACLFWWRWCRCAHGEVSVCDGFRPFFSSPLSSGLLNGGLAHATDSDCGALSTDEPASRTDYNLSFLSLVRS